MAPPRLAWRRPPQLLAAAVLLAVALAVATPPPPAAAHSFLTVPLPISRLDGCRIGGVGGTPGFCPGPCPNSDFRADTSSRNPAAVYRRGSSYEVRWTRNNHEGGIIRWAMVPVSEMWDYKSHERNAFHWSCWNINRFTCGTMDRQRDCYFDRSQQAFRDDLRIPDNLPDGDYILGWAWYGGGEGPVGKQAIFGDYYDCSFVRVEGGNTLTQKHYPTFTGDSGGRCMATVNRLGICKREPCAPMPYVARRVPAEFEGGRRPAPIYASNFPNVATQYRYDYDYSVYSQGTFTEAAVKPAGSSVRVFDLRLVDTHTNTILWNADLTKPIKFGRDAKLSIMAEVRGPAKQVQWYINSRQTHTDSGSPFSIAGDFRGRFYELIHAKTNRRMFITARAIGASGNEDYLSMDVVFVRDDKVPPRYIGTSSRRQAPAAALPPATRAVGAPAAAARPLAAAAAGGTPASRVAALSRSSTRGTVAAVGRAARRRPAGAPRPRRAAPAPAATA